MAIRPRPPRVVGGRGQVTAVAVRRGGRVQHGVAILDRSFELREVSRRDPRYLQIQRSNFEELAFGPGKFARSSGAAAAREGLRVAEGGVGQRVGRVDAGARLN